MQAVQGLLNYAPNGPKDGGLMLMKGSAKLFDEFFAQSVSLTTMRTHRPPRWNSRTFSYSVTNMSNGSRSVAVSGDFVLWDSRTMHHACPPEGDQIRHVQYICMTPAMRRLKHWN
jgi:uncharacterized protein VirK/YbjX